MPPRSAKKTPGPGPKRTAKVTKKVQDQPNSQKNASEKTDGVAVSEIKTTKTVEIEDDPEEVVQVLEKNEPEKAIQASNGKASDQKPDDVKESADDFERGERLELEDNDPDEPEEYGSENDEGEPEDGMPEGYDLEEDVEEGDEEGDQEEDDGGLEEEEDDGEDEMDDIQEGLEGEEDEQAIGEHVGMVDVEEEEHHEVVKERRKRKEYEIFVGGLDKDATEDDLKKVFTTVGDVTEIRLMMNPVSKKNKGFAFIRYATVEQANRAVNELKNPVVNGKQCGTSPSLDSDTLFLGNICKTWTKEALKEKLKYYGVENVEDITLVEDNNSQGMNRGFAFLEFSSRSDAMDAFKRLQKRDVVFGVDRSAKVSFADSFIDPGDEIMSQVKTVFIDGVLTSWDEDRLRDLLKKYGGVEKVELARNMPSAKRKDFGFVTFDSHDAAVTCAKSINNSELGEGDSKVKVRARLSRPLQRGRGKVPARDIRAPRMSGRLGAPWGRPLSVRGSRALGGYSTPPGARGLKRSISVRDRRPVALPVRSRPLHPIRSYEKRIPPVSSYPKSSIRRDYPRRAELISRRKAGPAYGPRGVSERRFRDEYPARDAAYSDLPRSSRVVARRGYEDDGYEPRYERPPVYREGRGRDYESVAGSKRPYGAVDDVPPRYSDAGGRHSRARLDYELGGGSSQYGDAYGDRIGRSSVGYGSGTRSSLSGSDSRGPYGSRHGGGYGDGMYSSSYGNSSDYLRGSDVGGGSYSLYSSRGYVGGGSRGGGGGGGSGSYY